MLPNFLMDEYKTFFNAPCAAWIATISRDDIQRVLASKEPKHATYRTRCDVAWLVINADTESTSTWFEFDPSHLADPFLTDFSRVFLVQHFKGKAFELNVRTKRSNEAEIPNNLTPNR